MGPLLSLVFSIGLIVAFFWSLDALKTLKEGQKEVLERLKKTELAQHNAELESRLNS